MKLQLDTTNCLITIEESVNLGEFIDILEKLLPDGMWKKFKIETKIINNWSNPIIINPYIPYNPTDMWQKPWITYNQSNTTSSLIDDVYSINITN